MLLLDHRLVGSICCVQLMHLNQLGSAQVPGENKNKYERQKPIHGVEIYGMDIEQLLTIGLK